MMYAVLAGALCALIAAGLVRPFLTTRRPSPDRSSARSPSASRSLLRQLRDLDDDLAAGRILDEDHQRLRTVLEAQAIDALRATPASTVEPDPRAAPWTEHGVRTARNPRWIRPLLALSIAATAAAGVTALLLRAIDDRPPLAGAGNLTAAGPSASTHSGAASRKASGGQLTDAQLAALEQAVAAVKSRPGRTSAHLELARAYAAAGQPQLASVEYLAAAKIDEGNAEANTALALVAFKTGNVRQADAMVSLALRTHPRYPEALYTRGLIRAMGLHRPAAAARDLEAYQDAAPRGSHRTTVATVLALLASGAIK